MTVTPRLAGAGSRGEACPTGSRAWLRIATAWSLAGSVVLVGAVPPSAASHGRLVGGVVVESARLEATRVPGQAAGCALIGAVENGSDQRVLVRVTYRARDPGGSPLIASARLPGVVPGERREFASSAFVRGDGTAAPCSGVKDIQLETAAEPTP